MASPKSPEHQALCLMTSFIDGTLTKGELIGQLAELPKETIVMLPYSGQPPCLRASVLELQKAISEGRTIRFGS
jgi:hypothetical protein